MDASLPPPSSAPTPPQPAPASKPDPNDLVIAPEKLPPGESRKERIGAKACLWGFLIWGIYLLVMWLAPNWKLWEGTVVVLDMILWPAIRGMGRMGGVAFLAVMMAFISLFAQWWWTDVRRLRVVKEKSLALRDEMMDIPKDCPRDKVLAKIVQRAQLRIAVAGFVSLGVLLGPMVAAFFWFPVRVEPDEMNSAPGAKVELSAEIDPGYKGQVRLIVPAGLPLSEQTPAVKDIQPPAGEPRVPQLVKWDVTLPGDRAAVYHVAVELKDSVSMPLALATGDAAPTPLDTKHEAARWIASFPGRPPILKVVMTYPDARSADERAFWRPFHWAHWNWDAGWLWLYMTVYVPAMFLFRWMLRLP